MLMCNASIRELAWTIKKEVKEPEVRTGRRIGDCKLRTASARLPDRTGESRERYVTRRGRERGGSRRKGKGRMQRIRKERSPAPAYVMPLSYCQPAPALFCLPGGKGKRESTAGALSIASRRKILIAPISIFGRSFACSLFDHPTKIPPATTRMQRTIFPQSRTAQTNFLQLSSRGDTRLL